MVDVAFGPAPAQDSVTQNKLDTLRLPVDAPIQGVQSFKYLHGGTSGLFVLCPLIARELPPLQGCGPCPVIIKVHDAWIACRIRLLLSLAHEDLFRGILPPRLKPGSKSIGRLRNSSKRWALDLQNESLAVVSRGLIFFGLGS